MASEEMRAADADRQRVAERLRTALDEGRLELSEYDDRLQQAYAAKTYGELELVTTDLPAIAPARPAAPAPGENPTWRWVVHVWDEYVTVVAVCVAIWLISGISDGWDGFWPIWVAGPWGAILVWQTISGLSNGEPQKWHTKNERKKLAKEQKKQQKELGQTPEGESDRPDSPDLPGRV